MHIDLAFGKTELPIHLPEGFRYRMLEARSAKPLPDSRAALESALAGPIGGPPLAEVARAAESADASSRATG